MRRLAVLPLVLLAAAPRGARAEHSVLSAGIDTVMAWDDAARQGDVPTGLTVPGRNLLPSINLAFVDGTWAIEHFHARLSIGFGDSLATLHQPAPGRAPGDEAWRYLMIGYVGYTLPVGRGLTIDAGLMPSHIGFETFPTREVWNYSHGFLADLSPYYQAGVRLSYPLTDEIAAQLLWLNGWDPIDQDRAFRSGGAQLTWTSERVRAALNLFAGPARAAGGQTVRLFGDAWAALAPIPQLQAAVVLDGGVDRRPDGSAWDNWWGLGAYIRYAPVERLSLALRADVHDDSEGGAVTGTPQRQAEITLTMGLALGPALLRGEVRLDRSTAPTLDGHTGRELFLLSLTASFDCKIVGGKCSP